MVGYLRLAAILVACIPQTLVAQDDATPRRLDVMIGNSDEYAETVISLIAPQKSAGFGFDEHVMITSVLSTVKETIDTARALMSDEGTHQAGTELMEEADAAFSELKGHIAERKLNGEDQGMALNKQQADENEERGMDVARQVFEVGISFPECVDLFLADCLAIINRQISGLGLATIEIIVRDKRNENQEGYNKVVIITNNLATLVKGRADDGMITYPFMWDDKVSGSRLLSSWNCVNITPEQCCLNIKVSVPNQDTKGNNIECHIFVPIGGIGKPKRNDRVFITVSPDGRVHEKPLIQ